MRIAVLANLKTSAPLLQEAPADTWAELDSPATTQAIVRVLEQAGHTAAFFEGNLSLVSELPRFAPDLCFNLCEGHFGDSRESHVPALLEMMRLPYTGASVLGLALTLDKPMTKRVLNAHGLPTPRFQVFTSPDEPLDPALAFPLFVKPAHEGSGIGVSGDSRVDDEAALRRQVELVLSGYREPALVERYVDGRELTIGLLGNCTGQPRALHGAWARLPRIDGVMVLPPYELAVQQFPESEGAVYTQRMKASGCQGSWIAGRDYHCPARLDPLLRTQLEQLAVSTFRVTGCRDIARVDIRLDSRDHDRPYILEINALPGIAPGWSDLTLAANAAGLSYEEIVLCVIEQAALRLGLALHAPHRVIAAATSAPLHPSQPLKAGFDPIA
jgi:D-alanine-D-alanine ligase